MFEWIVADCDCAEDYVPLTICRYDEETESYTADLDNYGERAVVWVLPSTVPAIGEAYPRGGGIRCSKIAFAGITLYVVGSPGEVLEQLKGQQHGKEKNDQDGGR